MATQKERFLKYLQTCVKSARVTEKNPLLLGGNAPKDYARFLEPDRLFDYNPNKWSHIGSMYDINDYSKALEIFNELIADKDFLLRDKEDNQGWRRGAISYYVCFLSAQQFFQSGLKDNDKVLRTVLKFESTNIVYFLANAIKEVLAYDANFNMVKDSIKINAATMGFKNCPFGKKASVQEANTDPRRQDDCDRSIVWRYKDDDYYFLKEQTLGSLQAFANNINGLYADKFRIKIDKEKRIYKFYLLSETVEGEDKLQSPIYDDQIPLEPPVKPAFSNPNPRVWLYSPGEQAKYWDECRQQGLIRLGFDEVGNFQQFDSRQAVLAKMKEVFGTNKPHDSLAVWQFLNDMQIGDIVYAKKGVFHIVGRGVVEGDYVYDDNLDELKHCRRIRWAEVGDWDAPFRLPQKTLTRLNADDPNIELLDKTISGTLRTIMPTESFSVKKMIKYIGETGLLYSDSLVKRFAFSLMSKRFLILSGLAGSGKTQLALAFASALVRNKEEQMCLVSVGADWTNREPLLGFPNALDPEKYVKPESEALDLLIEAKRPENADRPFFLILDEMNMSYVERYFADFLSAMESGQEIPLWDKPEECDSDVPPTIKLPKNLFIIGTINVDETTYMFSPKVLDRANVIEFKISPSEMETFLQEMKEIDREGIIGKAAGMGADFVNKACKKDLAQDKEAVDTLQNFFNELKNVNAEFGYRSATEIFRFICQAKTNDDSNSKMTDEEILDAAIVQKLLPKLHGSRKKLEPVLAQLWKLCFVGAGKDLNISKENVEKAQFKESADKIRRMYESATANGFTSFAEA